MQNNADFDLQAAHEREFEEEARERFLKKYPYRVIEALERIQVDLHSTSESTDFSRDIYSLVDKFVHGGLVDESLQNLREINATLMKIKYTLYVIAAIAAIFLLR